MRNGKYILVKAPDDYPGKRYRGRYCYEHTLVYWQTYGTLPKTGELIHHKDENPHNNDVSNLEITTIVDHTIYHRRTGVRMVRMTCVFCHNIFEKERRRTHLVKGGTYTCCNATCQHRFMRLSEKERKDRIENVFIEEFISK